MRVRNVICWFLVTVVFGQQVADAGWLCNWLAARRDSRCHQVCVPADMPVVANGSKSPGGQGPTVEEPMTAEEAGMLKKLQDSLAEKYPNVKLTSLKIDSTTARLTGTATDVDPAAFEADVRNIFSNESWDFTLDLSGVSGATSAAGTAPDATAAPELSAAEASETRTVEREASRAAGPALTEESATADAPPAKLVAAEGAEQTVTATALGEFRFWTKTSGRISCVQLIVARKTDSTVTLRREDSGAEFQYGIEELSKSDRGYIDSLDNLAGRTADASTSPAALSEQADQAFERASLGEFRFWTRINGRVSDVRAIVVDKTDVSVTLQREDNGKKVQYLIVELSKPDRDYISGLERPGERTWLAVGVH